MSLLMDALRRAEAEKKAAAESKSAEEKLERKESHQENSNEEKSAGKLNVRDDGDSQSSVSDELSEDDEDLGATVKLDRLPLSMTTKPEAADKPAVEDITSSIEESLNDLSIDFESTSPRMRSDEILSADRSRENRGNATDASGNKADSDHEEAFDFSIHAEPHLDKDGKPLELEPIHDAEITSA